MNVDSVIVGIALIVGAALIIIGLLGLVLYWVGRKDKQESEDEMPHYNP